VIPVKNATFPSSRAIRPLWILEKSALLGIGYAKRKDGRRRRLFYPRRQLFRFLCTNQTHLFKAGSFKSFSPWALHCLLALALSVLGSRPSPKSLSLFEPVFVLFVGLLAGFGSPWEHLFCVQPRRVRIGGSRRLSPMHQERR
jgi:hypothetical protein